MFAAQLLGLWLAVACAAAVSGSDKWLSIVRDQGTGPWAWNVFAPCAPAEIPSHTIAPATIAAGAAGFITSSRYR